MDDKCVICGADVNLIQIRKTEDDNVRKGFVT